MHGNFSKNIVGMLNLQYGKSIFIEKHLFYPADAKTGYRF